MMDKITPVIASPDISPFANRRASEENFSEIFLETELRSPPMKTGNVR